MERVSLNTHKCLWLSWVLILLFLVSCGADEMSDPDILLSKNMAPEKEAVTQEGTAAEEGTVTQEGTAAEEDGVIVNGSEGRKDEETEKKPESRYLTVFEEAASLDADTEYQYVYEDLDHNGSKELLAVVEGGQGYLVWYCADGAAECEMVCELNHRMDCYKLEILRLEGETHVAVNAYNMMGDSKYYSILALEDGSVKSLVSENWGYVYLNDEGEIVLDVEAYDGYYMADMGFCSTHTWKDTYLYFDGEKYREYGAVMLTEEEFLGRYENGSDILDEIRGQTETAQGESLVFSAIFVRGNGVVQIQCEHRYAGGDIHFFYYELRDGGDNRLFGMGMPNDGQMGVVLSELEAVFPE